MRLNYEQLPADIIQKYAAKEIHKIVKPSATSISLHLKSRTKDVWNKKGSNWFKMGQEDKSDAK